MLEDDGMPYLRSEAKLVREVVYRWSTCDRGFRQDLERQSLPRTKGVPHFPDNPEAATSEKSPGGESAQLSRLLDSEIWQAHDRSGPSPKFELFR